MSVIYAEKGNKVYSITENDVQKYLDMGCTITDGKGGVLAEGIPSDIQGLTDAYKKHTAEIATLKEEIATLKSENEALKKKTSTSKTKTTAKSKETAE